jgi:hypothetical protein
MRHRPSHRPQRHTHLRHRTPRHRSREIIFAARFSKTFSLHNSGPQGPLFLLSRQRFQWGAHAPPRAANPALAVRFVRGDFHGSVDSFAPESGAGARRTAAGGGCAPRALCAHRGCARALGGAAQACALPGRRLGAECRATADER